MSHPLADPERLVADWQGPLYNLALRVLGDPAAAEDATQKVFQRVLDRRAHYDPRRPLRPWLFRVATRVVRNEARARRVRRTKEAEHGQRRRAHEQEDPVERMEREALVQTHLGRLPADRRAVLALHYYSGLTQAEMAEVLDVPRTTVQSRLARALEELQAALTRGGHAALAPLAADVMRGTAPAPVPVALQGALASLVAASGPLAVGAAVPLVIGGLVVTKKLIAATALVLVLGSGLGYTVARVTAPDVPAEDIATAERLTHLEAENRRLGRELAALRGGAPELAGRAAADRPERTATADPGHTPATAPETAAAAGSGIDWTKLRDLLASTLDVILSGKERDMSDMSSADQARVMQVLTEFMRVSALAHTKHPRPFFDEQIASEYLDAIFSGTLDLDAGQRQALTARTRALVREAAADLDDALLIERFARRQGIRHAVEAHLADAVRGEQVERLEQIREVTENMLAGDHERIGFGLGRGEEDRQRAERGILASWQGTYELDEAQRAELAPAAARLVTGAEDALRRRGLFEEGAEPAAADVADLHAAFHRLQVEAETGFQARLTETQRAAGGKGHPRVFVFAYGEPDGHMVVSGGGI